MPALAELSHRAVEAKKWIVWVAPPFVPYAPALAHHGVDLSRILLVHPPRKKHTKKASAEKGSDPFFAFSVDPGDVLWAVEQAIRSQSSIATLAWVRVADVTALRRLQLGAEAHRCWTVLFRPLEAVGQSSPAALRFRLLPARGSAGSVSSDGESSEAESLDGHQAGIRVEIQKCRGRKPRNFLL